MFYCFYMFFAANGWMYAVPPCVGLAGWALVA